MFRRTAVLAVCALAVGLLPAGAVRADIIANPAPVVYVEGDSVTASAYLPNPGRDGFGTRLANRICGEYCGQPGHATVINQSSGGQRIGQLAARWPSILAATPKPTTIVVEIGVNDLVLESNDQIAESYKYLVFSALDAGIRVIPCLISPLGSSRTDIESAREALNGWLVGYWGAGRVARFDWAIKLPWNEWMDPTYRWDDVHPNPYGVMREADAVPLDQIV